MSWRRQNTLAVFAGTAALLAIGALGVRARHAARATVGIPSASAAPSTSAAEPPAPPALKFVFDCAMFAPAASTCAVETGPGQALLDLVNVYRVSALPCSIWLGQTLDAVATAVQGAERLDPKALAPLDRALLQNAALELASCSSKLAALEKPAGKANKLSASARGLVLKFALSAPEVSALPTAAALVSPFLGDGAAWHRGLDSRFVHTGSDGFARAHQQLQQGETLGDIARLVLVTKAGEPFVTDVVQRVVLRRKTEDAVHACIAELSPRPASCGPAALLPLDPVRGERVLAGGPGTPGCWGCHGGNAARAIPYGADTGFQLSDAAEPRIKTALKSLALHSGASLR